MPWTQCVDLLGYGLMGGAPPGLNQLWPLANGWAAAVLSLAVLAIFATITQALAQRSFSKSTVK